MRTFGQDKHAAHGVQDSFVFGMDDWLLHATYETLLHVLRSFNLLVSQVTFVLERLDQLIAVNQELGVFMCLQGYTKIVSCIRGLEPARLDQYRSFVGA